MMNNQRHPTKPDSPPIGLVILGLGHVARHHMAAIARLPGLTLRAAHDIDTAKAALLPEGIPFYPDLDSIVTRKDIDLHLVATPTRTHFAVAGHLLERGKAVLLEKPMSATRREMRDLCTLARKTGASLSVALHAAYGGDVLHWLTMHESFKRQFGPLTGFECAFYDPYHVEGKLRPSALSLQNSWLDSGINALSVVGLLLPPESMTLEEVSRPAGEAGTLKTRCRFSFAHEGVTGQGSIDTNWTLGVNNKTTRLFFGSSGTAVLLDHSRECVVIHHGTPAASEHSLANGHHRLENHYYNLFSSLCDEPQRRTPHLAHVLLLHDLLYSGAGDAS